MKQAWRLQTKWATLLHSHADIGKKHIKSASAMKLQEKWRLHSQEESSVLMQRFNLYDQRSSFRRTGRQLQLPHCMLVRRHCSWRRCVHAAESFVLLTPAALCARGASTCQWLLKPDKEGDSVYLESLALCYAITVQ
eukprot:2567265-Pleurochrysis_carterae.AAC.2